MTMTIETTAPAFAAALELLEMAEEAGRAASAAQRRVEEMLARALRAHLKAGMVIDLRQRKGLPEYLWSTKTMGGNDRGTKVFRIESEPVVDVSLSHIELAHWRCHATPISEKTGKPMSGATHGANSHANGGLCRLQGHVFRFALDMDDTPETPEARHKRITAEMARFSAALPPARAATTEAGAESPRRPKP